jgi:hypothetical protein
MAVKSYVIQIVNILYFWALFGAVVGGAVGLSNGLIMTVENWKNVSRYASIQYNLACSVNNMMLFISNILTFTIVGIIFGAVFGGTFPISVPLYQCITSHNIISNIIINITSFYFIHIAVQ